MNRFNDMPINHDPGPRNYAETAEIRAAINADVEAFVAAGGVIEELPEDATAFDAVSPNKELAHWFYTHPAYA